MDLSPAAGRDFTFDFAFRPTPPPLPEGENGYSRKGPMPESASYYDSMPHLNGAGIVMRAGKAERVTAEAWLNRAWSSNYLAPDALGGTGLDDGAALMVFHVRRDDGTLWAGGSYRVSNGRISRLLPGEVAFMQKLAGDPPEWAHATPLPKTIGIRLPEGVRRFPLRPMFADWEVDARLPVSLLLGGRGTHDARTKIPRTYGLHVRASPLAT